MTLKKIIHLSDIHIRLYKRHQEYRECFSELYAALRKYKTDISDTLIVITGDLLHAKTDMSPEMVQLASEFLKTLADICPTAIIAGNHDMNLSNKNRLDSITPIVNSLEHPNLMYWKNSGIYTINQVDFAVMSLLDTNWPLASDCTSPIKIALYHGPILDSETDVGYTVTNSTMKLSDFNGFDLVLLGDIHKRQQLSTDTTIAAYPGSLIQQNFGETLFGHGWIEWNLEDNSIEFFELKNKFGYVTIRTDEKFDYTTLPENSRIRLFSHYNSKKNKQIIEKIKKYTSILEISINKLHDKTFDNSGSISLTDTITNVSYQNQLLSSYIMTKYPLLQSDNIKKICEINEEFNKKLIDDDLPKNVFWKPIELKFDNLFSYGEGNYIKFENLNGFYGLFSPNASGKSSAVEALCFALFDKTPRAFKGSYIMNTRSNTCKCELLLEIGNDKYKIIRSGDRKKNGEVKIDVNFYQIKEDGTEISLNGIDRRDTNSIIRSYVGSYDDFILTTLSVQNQNSLFIEQGQTDRKELLSQFMGLTIFDKLSNICSDEIKELNGIIKYTNINELETKLVIHNDNVLKLTSQLEEISDKLETERSNLILEQTQFIEKKSNLREDLKDIDIEKVMKSKSELTSKILNIESSILKKTTTIQDITDIINGLTTSLRSYEQFREKNTEFEIQTIEKSKLEYELASAEKKLSELNKHELDLSKHQYDPNCKYCINNSFVKNATSAIKQIPDVRFKITEISDKIKSITVSLEILTEYQRLHELYIKTSSTIQDKMSNVKLINMELDTLNANLKTTKLQLTNCEAEISEYYNQEEVIVNNNKINSELVIISNCINKILKDIKKFEDLYKSISGDLQYNQIQCDTIKFEINKLNDITKKINLYSIYENSISKNGLPYQMISNVVPSIEHIVNNILSQIVEFSVIMEVDGKNVNAKISYDENRTWPLDLASGMEKFVSSLAIRIALMKISNLPRSNFIIIDEGLGVLDRDNLSSIHLLFDILKIDFEFIILISHLDIVRDIADELLEISFLDGYSKITID